MLIVISYLFTSPRNSKPKYCRQPTKTEHQKHLNTFSQPKSSSTSPNSTRVNSAMVEVTTRFVAQIGSLQPIFLHKTSNPHLVCSSIYFSWPQNRGALLFTCSFATTAWLSSPCCFPWCTTACDDGILSVPEGWYHFWSLPVHCGTSTCKIICTCQVKRSTHNLFVLHAVYPEKQVELFVFIQHAPHSEYMWIACSRM